MFSALFPDPMYENFDLVREHFVEQTGLTIESGREKVRLLQVVPIKKQFRNAFCSSHPFHLPVNQDTLELDGFRAMLEHCDPPAGGFELESDFDAIRANCARADSQPATVDSSIIFRINVVDLQLDID